MNRRVDQLICSPGVVSVLAALYNGPLAYLSLCAHLPYGRGRNDAVSALRMLASFGMVRRKVCAGSWDQPDPVAIYELTDRGHTFAGLWFDLQALLSEHPHR